MKKPLIGMLATVLVAGATALAGALPAQAAAEAPPRCPPRPRTASP